MWIKGIVNELVESYGTNNPFEIAELKNIKVIEHDLHPDIFGFYKYIRRNMFIFINIHLEYYEKDFTCAHELGHSQLHPRLNTPFLKKNTLFSTSKIEREANRFAVELLIDDIQLNEYHDTILTVEGIATDFNIPVDVVNLKKI